MYIMYNNIGTVNELTARFYLFIIDFILLRLCTYEIQVQL